MDSQGSLTWIKLLKELILGFLHHHFRCFLISTLRSKRTDFGPHDWHSMPVSGAQTWLVVPGLEPGTEYQFSVLAQNKLGTGPFSEVVTVNTAGGFLIKGFPIYVNASWLQSKPTEAHWDSIYNLRVPSDTVLNMLPSSDI